MRVRTHLTPSQDNNASSAEHAHGNSNASSFIHPSRIITSHHVPAAHGHAFLAPQGSHFRIIDTHGEQVVDFMAWVHDPSSSTFSLEKLSTAYTRYHLNGVAPAINECLYSNADRALLRVTADTVKVHDMTFMSCFPKLYQDKGITGHRSCAMNIFEAMKEYGMSDVLQIAEPFNCFQNTPNYSLKAMGSSRAGDYIEFEALVDLVCAVSSCPYDLDGFNGGEVTSVEVQVSRKRKA